MAVKIHQSHGSGACGEVEQTSFLKRNGVNLII